MILRAVGLFVVLLNVHGARAEFTDSRFDIGVDGKVLPAITQEYFDSDPSPAPQLRAVPVREPLPPKYAPPTVQLFAAVASGTVDSFTPVRLTLAVIQSVRQPIVMRQGQSREPPLAEIP